MAQKIEGPIKMTVGKNTFNIKGGITAGGKIVDGDQTNTVIMTPQEPAAVSAQVQSAQEQARAAVASEALFTPENAPAEYFSDDFVAGTIDRGGVKYKLDSSTIDQESHYRYVRVQE